MVEIVAYKPDWPTEFQTIAADLRQELGELALRIDHIGSTAVPGLGAKDVIDVQITVAALDEGVIGAMHALGYSLPAGDWNDHCPPTFVGPKTEWEKLFFRPPAGQRRTNTHVRVRGRATSATRSCSAIICAHTARRRRPTPNSNGAWRNTWRIRKPIPT